ncbi:sigma-70 family RNA polymerase sigma factor [Amycolatopsis saalfeldensis]|uniref:RNA polymerase sigma-70 factor, ECF subfamily n=1 Tax=Amycolatopsis saalfeldensis TaxID=394193 RepID=A0A1H8UD82_9PSEU|nr:sigma-70 family RNA polymerase sigma factor [Amycolatopsis saalfeldensis]SEP01180.1 RNA polymerase sigma-70 factor, ECF subfamily [Amycolatopsis saalfeldensis]
MDERDLAAQQFETHRAHLRAVAYRMLGSLAEADDAVQEAWLRFSRAGTEDVGNLGGWLTTVVSRVCLDVLRSRASRREEPAGDELPDQAGGTDPGDEAVLADSVGLALLVVLDTLSPAERLAFVLHDIFALPFEEIAPIVDRAPAAARQLASRARRRVRGGTTASEAGLARRRRVVDAFLAAAREGDFTALVAVLDPDVVLRVDGDDATVVRGAEQVANGARRFSERARFARPALVDGKPGIIVAPLGRLTSTMAFTVDGDRITGIEIVTEPERLAGLEVAVF